METDPTRLAISENPWFFFLYSDRACTQFCGILVYAFHRMNGLAMEKDSSLCDRGGIPEPPPWGHSKVLNVIQSSS